MKETLIESNSPSLIKCEVCGKEISNQAAACPSCGHPVASKIKSIQLNPLSIGKSTRKCMICNYSGEMNTWLANYSLPQFIALILLLFFLIPGLIFIAWGWGKYKCPYCGTLAKNVPI